MKLNRLISFFLLLLFTQATFPEFLIHELTGHHDTVDCPLSAEKNISTQHTHCESLNDQLPTFNTTQLFSLGTISVLLSNKVVVPVLFTEQLFQFHFPSRGPPEIIS